MHQVSRSHSFKKRIEKSDDQLKQYIKSLTVIVEEPMKEIPQLKPQPVMQEIQIQRPEPQIQQSTPLIIANLNPTMLNGQQLIQTASGQIIQAQIGQFVQGPNNTIQMITTQQPQLQQLLQIRPEQDNRLTQELIVQPEMNDNHQYYEEIPVYVQSANGQQTILNLHHQVQALQQQVQNQNQQQQQTTSSSETDEIEIQEVQNYEEDDYNCEDLEEMVEDDNLQEVESESTTYYVEQDVMVDVSQDDEEIIDKKLLADFLSQHAIQVAPSKFACNLCQNEFKSMKWLESHMKTIHSNWIKANVCKKQPTCQICGKSFRGPGMLKMHLKTHERENKIPTCSVCGNTFKSKSILYRHRATHFSDQKQHICSICNKTFNTNYQLNAHIARHKNHQCGDCEKSFSNAADFKVNLSAFVLNFI